MQRSLKFRLPRESVPFICFSCLSSSSIFFFRLLVNPCGDFVFILGRVQMAKTGNGLRDVDMNWRSRHILILDNMNFILRNTGMGSWVMCNWQRRIVLEPPHHHGNHVSKIFELILHVVELRDWNWWLLNLLIFYFCIWTYMNWTQKGGGALLGAILEYPNI